MLLDVVSPSNYLTFNIKLAHVLGLTNAVYCAELLDIYSKAIRKNKDYNKYFYVNREYIKTRTSIPVKDQFFCDASLEKAGLLSISEESSNKIKLEIEMIMQIIADEDVDALNKISKKIAVKANKIEAERLTRNSQREELHKAVKVGNEKIESALHSWIDVIFRNKSKFITKDTVVTFQNALCKYTKSDVTTALKIVNIAKSLGHTDCVDAIQSFEKGQKTLETNKQMRTTPLKVATQDNLSKKKY